MSSTDAGKTWLHRVIYDPLLIQFIHRSLAYLLCGLFVAWFLLSRPLAPAGGAFLNWPPTLLITQVSTGIFACFAVGLLFIAGWRLHISLMVFCCC
ncbi:hypothetical protein HK413_01095 [Mucilaginibacter sp. S1162]|uniref:Uncharacterized protein n=1 Tax=Mucilaginibacter humi TaxID=2732510 RepID=A0ABX1W0K2_9SPHI|nr:hypothetical protein [Mucilaginibacter humi]